MESIFMQIVVELINSAGKAFVGYAMLMLVQSGVLIVILLAADFLLRRKVRAIFRYWLWMLILAKLLLPPTLSSPVSIGRFMAAQVTAADAIKKSFVDKNFHHQSSSEATAVLQLNSPSASPLLLSNKPTTPPAELNLSAVSLTWQGGIFLLWLTIVSVMLLLLLQRAVFVCGLVRQSNEASHLTKDMLGLCCKTMGIRGRVGLKVSHNTTSPAVCGLFRPVILLPDGLDSNLNSDQLKTVLTHELAHLRQDDLWINLLQTVLQIVYFYNPLLWLANWTIRRVREQAVDECVQVSLGEGARQYPETLLTVARLAFQRPALSMGLIGVIESKSALAGRIKKMLNQPEPKTAKLGLIGTVIILLIGIVTLPMAKGMADSANKPRRTHRLPDSKIPSLKNVFAKDFLIGTAVNDDIVSDKDSVESAVVKKHYSSITPENVLKWETIHPASDKYVFEPADRFVDFGLKNKMFIVGHVLVGREQVPDWVFKGANGQIADRETLLARMREHIFKVMEHYKGKIKCWDVVNEAIGYDGKISKTKWSEIIGDDYIAKAFEYAHEADPEAELYYNDYDVCNKEHRDGVIRLVKDLQSKGIRIDGIGIEGHWELGYPSLEDIEAAITAYTQLGVKIAISEMDITVLPNPDSYSGNDKSGSCKKLNPYPAALPDKMQEKLAKRYADLFSIFHKHADKISRVTTWGVFDETSWRNVYPIKGRTDYPLLFDRQLQPKPAFFAVVKTAQENKSAE